MPDDVPSDDAGAVDKPLVQPAISEGNVISDVEESVTETPLMRAQEGAREHFGWAIFILLVLMMIGGPSLAHIDPTTWGKFGSFYGQTLTALLTLLASVIGYYYGSRKS